MAPLGRTRRQVCARVLGAVPVEVKSTENARSRSLGVYREKYRPNRVVRVSARDFGTGDVESIPLYAVGCLADGLALAQGSSSPLPPRSHGLAHAMRQIG